MKEEENLFYVSITRAKDVLITSYFEKYNSGRKVKKSIFFEQIEHKTRKFDHSYDEIKIKQKSSDSTDIKLIDYSAISTFIDCQERFKINYLYGFKATQIFTQKIGIIYHNSIAKVNSLLDKNEVITDTKIDQVMKDSWIDLGETKNKIWRHKIKLGLKRYSKFMKDNLKKIIGIEKPISVMKDQIRIRGRADIVYVNKEGEIVVMDYKSRNLKSIEETHTDIQLKFYSDALKKDGQRIDKAIAYPIEEQNLNIDDATVSLDNDKHIKKLLDSFVKCIKYKNYEGTKKGSTFCSDCPYKHMCKKKVI